MKKKERSRNIGFIALACFLIVIVVLLAYMVVQREKQIRLLSSAITTAKPSTSETTVPQTQLTARDLLGIAQQDPQVKNFIAGGDYQTYLDILDNSDFQRMPAIYKDLPRQNLYQINYTRGDRALLVILTPTGVLKVVPVTNLRIL